MSGWSRTVRIASALFMCVVGAELLGCKQEAASTPSRPIPEVGVVTVTARTVPDEPEFIGQSESSRPVEIRSQVTGILKERYFQEGRVVKKGDRLYLIDPVPFRAAAQSAKAKVHQAEARLVQAEQNLAMVRPLVGKERAMSKKELIDAVAEELAAKAQLESARADLVKAEFDLGNTLITAPIAGLIERTHLYEGRLISAQTDLLTIIHQVDPMYVTVSVPERVLLKRRRDLAAKKIQDPGVYKLKGTLIFMDGSVYPHEGALDLLDPGMRMETGSRQARVTFPNPDGVLVPGQFVTVRFHGASKTDAILVPQRAVQHGPNGPILYVVGADHKVEVRQVRASGWHGDQWLIEEGLQPGERIVVDGLQRVIPGQPVKPVPAADGATPLAAELPKPTAAPRAPQVKTGAPL